MILFPAIDLIDGQAVRLVKGDYNQMTVYEKKALNAALRFQNAGAKYLHLVDLQGAKDGGTPNLATVEEIVKNTHLRVEIGGGIRDEQTVERYLQLGVYRVTQSRTAVGSCSRRPATIPSWLHSIGMLPFVKIFS